MPRRATRAVRTKPKQAAVHTTKVAPMDGSEPPSDVSASSSVRSCGYFDADFLASVRSRTRNRRKIPKAVVFYQLEQVILKKNLLKELFFLVLHFACLALVVSSLRNVYVGHSLEEAARDGLAELKTASGRTFLNLGDVEGWWDWVEHGLIPAVYSEEWYNGDAREHDFLHTIGYKTKIVGGIRMQQHRYTENEGPSCFESPFDAIEHRCLTAETASHKTFGESHMATEHCAFRYTHHEDEANSGFELVLGLEGHSAEEEIGAVEELRRLRWIDDATHTLHIDMTLYSASTKQWVAVRFEMIFDLTGGIHPREKIHVLGTMDPYNLSSSTNVMRTVFEVFWVGLLLLQTFRFLNDFIFESNCGVMIAVKRQGLIMLLMEVAQLVAMWLLFAWWIYFLFLPARVNLVNRSQDICDFQGDACHAPADLFRETQEAEHCIAAHIESEACIAGHYCPVNTQFPLPCPKDTFLNVTGATSDEDCEPCPPNTHTQHAGSLGCIHDFCLAGHSCAYGHAGIDHELVDESEPADDHGNADDGHGRRTKAAGDDAADDAADGHAAGEGAAFTTFPDLIPVVAWNETYTLCVLFIILMTCLRALQFFAVSKKGALLVKALNAAGPEIIGFMPVFAVINFSFAFSGHLLFGYRFADWATVNDSVFNVVYANLGGYDLSQLFMTHTLAAYLYVYSLLVICSIVVINVFLAIVMSAWDEIATENVSAKIERIWRLPRISTWELMKVACDQAYGDVLEDILHTIRVHGSTLPKADGEPSSLGDNAHLDFADPKMAHDVFDTPLGMLRYFDAQDFNSFTTTTLSPESFLLVLASANEANMVPGRSNINISAAAAHRAMKWLWQEVPDNLSGCTKETEQFSVMSEMCRASGLALHVTDIYFCDGGDSQNVNLEEGDNKGSEEGDCKGSDEGDGKGSEEGDGKGSEEKDVSSTESDGVSVISQEEDAF